MAPTASMLMRGDLPSAKRRWSTRRRPRWRRGVYLMIRNESCGIQSVRMSGGQAGVPEHRHTRTARNRLQTTASSTAGAGGNTSSVMYVATLVFVRVRGVGCFRYICQLLRPSSSWCWPPERAVSACAAHGCAGKWTDDYSKHGVSNLAVVVYVLLEHSDTVAHVQPISSLAHADEPRSLAIADADEGLYNLTCYTFYDTTDQWLDVYRHVQDCRCTGMLTFQITRTMLSRTYGKPPNSYNFECTTVAPQESRAWHA
jgi:hypothetical protein